MRFHLAFHRKARPASSWGWDWPDRDSYGAINLGRYRIDFGRKR